MRSLLRPWVLVPAMVALIVVAFFLTYFSINVSPRFQEQEARAVLTWNNIVEERLDQITWRDTQIELRNQYYGRNEGSTVSMVQAECDDEFEIPVDEQTGLLSRSVLVLSVSTAPHDLVCIADGESRDWDGVSIHVERVGPPHEIVIGNKIEWTDYLLVFLPVLLLMAASGLFGVLLVGDRERSS